MTKKLTPGRNVRYPKRLVAKLETLSFYTDPEAVGTTQYYYLTFAAKWARLVGTDGIKIMCEELKCFWVLDLLVGLQPRFWGAFYVVYIVKTDDGGYYLMLDDGNGNIMYCKRYPYTDIKENLKLFLAPSEDLWVLYLPSEH